MNNDSFTDDFDDWDDWVKMSDKEQDAAVEKELAAYLQMIEKLPYKERISHHKQMALENCLGWRRILKTWNLDCFRDNLRDCQMRLLQIRTWQYTGIYPGNS